MNQDLQAVFNDLREMANNVLAAAGQSATEYPWEAIKPVHRAYTGAVSKNQHQKAEQLRLAVTTLQLWYDALKNLGNTSIPADVDSYPWFPESKD